MEKVGKMVFKMKPSKSGINKLPLFRQFRPACKKLGSSDETFWRTWKFSAKRYMYIFYSTSAREGPLPLPNCFFCYTRPSRGYCFAPPTRPKILPTHLISQSASTSFLKFDSFRSWNWLMVFPNTWNFDRQISNYLIEHFSNHFFE